MIRVAEYLIPSDEGDPIFTWMLNGRWQRGYGTTCGYLVHVALFLAGARDDRLVNYDDPGGQSVYRNGANISKIVQGARALGAFVDDAPGREPQRGDVAFLSNGPPVTEHVEIVGDPSGWEAWAAGQTNDRGEQAARLVTRPVDDRRTQGGPRLLGAPLPLSSGDKRKLVGWVDLDRVPWPAEPSGPAEELIVRPSGWAIAAGVALAATAAGVMIATLQPPPRPPR